MDYTATHPLRTLRKAKGYTQYKLASLAGTSQTVIWQIEYGHMAPSKKMVARLAKALRCRQRDLLLKEDMDA